MKKKVLITGILGYIGRELAELYKNSEYEVIGIDNNFVEDRVDWLTDNNIKFYRRDIFEIEDLLQDTSLVYHLAGITQVPQRLEDSTPEIDELIYRVGTGGTNYLLDKIEKDTKIVFVSTHCVFEGYQNWFNINEWTVPYPILVYAKSKFDSEKELKNHQNHIIARLGSLYGYNPWMREKIVTNILSKNAATTKKIKVFGGETYKPVIGAKDCGLALKFLGESDNKGIFHLVNENIKVKHIAELCRKFVANLEIEEILDYNKNQGYTLSNKYLLDNGFYFRQNIEDEIGRMINIWK